MNEIDLTNLNKSIKELLQLKVWIENSIFKSLAVPKSLIEYNTNTSIPRDINPEDIVRTTYITNEDVEITG